MRAPSLPSPARKCACLVVAILGMLQASTARADTPFVAPAECGSGDAFEARVSAARDPVRAESDAGVEITRDDGGYTLLVRTSTGTRTLNDRDCAPLLDAAVLIVALGDAPPAPPVEAASDVVTARPESAPPLATPRPPRPSHARSTTRPSDELAQAARTPFALRAALSGALDTGLVPGVSSTFAASLALARGSWAVRLGAHYTTPKRASNGALGLRVDGFGPALDVLWQVAPRLGLELGGDLFVLRVRGQDALSGRTAWALQAALHAGGTAALLARDRWALEAFVRGYVLPTPAAFKFAGQRLYEGSPVAALLGLSLRAEIF